MNRIWIRLFDSKHQSQSQIKWNRIRLDYYETFAPWTSTSNTILMTKEKWENSISILCYLSREKWWNIPFSMDLTTSMGVFFSLTAFAGFHSHSGLLCVQLTKVQCWNNKVFLDTFFFSLNPTGSCFPWISSVILQSISNNTYVFPMPNVLFVHMVNTHSLQIFFFARLVRCCLCNVACFIIVELPTRCIAAWIHSKSSV